VATAWSRFRVSSRDWYIITLTDRLIAGWTSTLISEMTGPAPTAWS